MTNDELKKQINLLDEQSRQLFREYRQTGNEQVRLAMADIDRQIEALRGQMTYEKGQFAGIVARLKQEALF